MISPGRSRLSYLNAEGQWTRVGVIEVGAASVRLLIANRRPAHAIPLWDHNAPVPAQTLGYQLRTVADDAVLLDVARTADAPGPPAAELVRAVASLVERADAGGCDELHIACEVAAATSGERLETAQTVARSVGRPVHLLTPHRTSELLALGAAEALDGREDSDALLVRCGGASTEVVLIRNRRRRTSAVLPVGVETLSARHSAPPKEGELKVLRQRVRSALNALPAVKPTTLVVCAEAGEAVKRLPALAGVERQDTVSLEGVRRALRTLQSTHPARLARSARLPEAELRRLPSAALIVEALLEKHALDACHLTPRGLRHGVIIAAAEDSQHWWVDLEAARLRRERLESVGQRDVPPSGAPLAEPQPVTGSTYT